MQRELASSHVKAKGINFRTMLKMLERQRGPNSVAATLALLPADVRDALETGALVTGGWYPVAWYRELHIAMQKACNAGPELGRKLGRDSLIEDFNSVFKLVFKLLSPETLFAQAPRLVAMYWQGGTAEHLQVVPGRGSVRLRGWEGFDHNIWQDIIGGCEGLLLVRGAKTVASHIISGGGDNDSHLEAEFRWSM